MHTERGMRRANHHRGGCNGGRASSFFLLSPAVLPIVAALFFLFVQTAVAFAGAWSPETELRTYLKAHYPWAEVDISDLQMSAVPPAERPAAIIVEKTPPGRSMFRFAFRRGRSIVVTALVKTFDRVFMSRNAFRKDYVLRQGDIYPTLMETCRIPRGAVREENRLLGKPLVRSIIQNAPLTDGMVSETPIVKRGHTVVLSVDSSVFSIKAMGETRQDAAVGDYVKVMNLSSKKIVTGLLVDEGTVRVEY
jgi:flagella basal body P-ring formation protein FlgA